jgi:predicted small integral membrane protein
MPINITQFTNFTGDPMTGLMRAVNTESEQMFGIMLLIAIYLIVFVPATRFGVKTAFSAAAFIGALFAVLLRYMGIIQEPVLYASIIIVVIAVMVVWYKRDT